MAAQVVPSDDATVADGTYSLFFYGTLVHPAVLARVIGNPGSHLSVQIALLPGHVLHHVSNADYPALLPLNRSVDVRGGASGGAASVVRGTLVRGLKPKEVECLDIFEGEEYCRKLAHVIPVPWEPCEANDNRSKRDSIETIFDQLTLETVSTLLGDPASATTAEPTYAYFWASPLSILTPKLWDFSEFAKSKAQNWTLDANKLEDEPQDEGFRLVEEKRAAEQSEENNFDLGKENLSLNATPAEANPWAESLEYTTAALSPNHVLRPANPWASDSLSIAGGSSTPRTGDQSSAWKDGFATTNVNVEKTYSDPVEQGFPGLSLQDQGFGLPRLGHNAKVYWDFSPGYTNLNNG